MSKYTAEQVRACILAYKNGDLNYCRSGIVDLLTEYAATLDAEGDGGAVAWPKKMMDRADTSHVYGSGYAAALRDAEEHLTTHPARSGVVAEIRRERSEVWVVQDENGQPIYCASWPEACHEHINEAINEHGIEEAKAWKVLHYANEALAPRENTVDIKAMAARFMGWRLPDYFRPDCGISFNSDSLKEWPGIWPVGTNLFTADQAEQMFRYVLDAAPSPGESA